MPVSPLYVAAELAARQRWANHEFGEAAAQARAAADIALREGDGDSWRNMTVLQAESLLAAGQFEECAGVVRELLGGSGIPAPRLRAQAHILMAKALQGSGLLDEAADEARAAAELTKDEDDVEFNVMARQALIGVLADSGQLEQAWTESLVLADTISDEVDDQLVGKAYWVIGNVAFLCNKVADGLEYHDLAASTFSPSRNLGIWARFNTASAAMRLAADIADADTLRCIDRAELAIDVIGGSDEDRTLLKLNRGHWNFLAGDPAAAIAVLEDIIRPGQDNTPPQILGEACLLLGRAHAAVGDRLAAREHLLQAVEHFEASGAPQRADQAQGFLAALD